MHGAEQSGVLREDLNFRGFHSLTLAMLALLLLFNYQLPIMAIYQFSTPPFLYQKTYKKPTNYLLHKIMAELLQELVIVLQRRDWQ